MLLMTGKRPVNEAFPQKKHLGKWWNVILLLLLFSFQGFSQEICNNGIDDDGDNLVDVFDPDCPCDDQTLLCQPTCEYAVPGGALNFTTQWSSSDTVPNYQTPLVADIDNDGVPEVIIMAAKNNVLSDPRRAKDLYIISGNTGATESTITTPYMAWVGPDPYAVADIDGDGFGEIIIASIDHSDNAASDRRYLFCYEHTGALKWKSNVQYGYAGVARFGSSVGITDFNSDGVAEVYIYNQIFNAATGVLLVEGGSAGGKAIMTQQSWGDVANPVAANLTTHSGLELACGNTVYNVTITNTSGTAGNTMSPIVIPGQADGYTSLADIDLDGNLDVVVASEGSTAKIYVWNPGNGTPSLLASISLPNTGGNWIGVPFIGDMDKDCQPEIGVTRSRRVYALDYNGTSTLSTKWTLVTTDASGFTGITMFDFNQDGTQELVYRDESTLRIIDGSGSSPVTVGTNPCSSGTGSEMPVVADVDGDGQAEICVSCAVNGVSLGRVNVFSSVGQAWAPCRSIWNQYSYFNVNINTNLSIPLQQQQHQVLLSNVTCPFFTCSENRPFNSFLTQATFLTQEGCPVYPASDVALSILNSSCNGSGEYDLTLEIENVGAAPSDSGYPIRFYAGNPLTSAATLIPVLSGPNATSQALNPGDTESISYSLDIAALPKPFNLFVILNDDGLLTAPFSFPLSTLPECNFADNVISISNIDCCPFGDLAISGFSPPTASFCAGGSSDLSVLASSTVGLNSAVYTWTLPDASVITGDTIQADQGGTYSVSVKDDAQCTVSSTVDITETPLPTTAAAGNDQTICEDNTALEGNIPSVGNGTWTLISGTGTIVNSTSATSSVTGISIGTSVFRWAILNGTDCLSDDTVSITRIDPPSNAVAGVDQSVCVDVVTLGATLPIIGTGSWSLVSGAGTITDASSISTTVTGLAVGANVFQWTVSNGVCPSSNDQVTITRFAVPSIADAGSNQTVCIPTASMGAATLIVGSGQWTLISGTGNFADDTDPVTQITGLSVGTNVFEWTVSNGTCAATTDQVEIVRNELPSQAEVGPDQVVCATTATLSATAPLVGSGAWTLLSGSGTISDEFSETTSVTNLGAGANVFQWTVSNGVCLPSAATLTITRDLPPDVSTAGNDQEICTDATQLEGNSPSLGSGLWTVVSGSATFDDATLPTSSISDLVTGTTVLQWTISNGVCPASSDQVSIQIDAPVSIPDAGSDFSVCAANASLAASTPTTGTGQWSLQSGTATITNPNSANSGITGLVIGTAVFRWTVTNGTCTDFDEVSVTRTAPPDQAIAGIDQELCSNSTLLAASLVITGTGQWSILNGAATFTDSSDPADLITDIAVGSNQLIWTVSSGVCPSSSDTVTIVVDANPVTPDAGSDQEICADATSLNAIPASVGTGEWTVISGSGILANASSSTSGVTGLSAGANVFRWTITNGTCIAFDQVSIVRDLPPSAAIAGADQEICQGETVTLNATSPTSGTGAWTLISGQGTITDSTSAQSSVTALQPGNVVLQWTVSSGVCTEESDQVAILVNANNLSALAGNDQTICSDTSSVSANQPLIGTGVWTVVSGSGILADSTSASTSISGLQPGANTFRWTVSNGTCPPVFDELTIQVDVPPSAALAGLDQQICTDNSTLTATAPSSGSGLWTLVTGSATFGDNQNPTSSISAIGVGVNVLQWTVSNGVCPSVNDQVIIIRDSIPVQANAGVDFSVCNSDTAALQALEPTPGTGIWTVISGSATFDDASSPLAIVSGLVTGSNQFVWTVTTGNCPTTSDTVTIQNLQPPSTANAGSDTSLCSTTSVLNAVQPVIGSGTWTSLSGVVFDDISSTNASVSNLQPGLNTLIWTVSNGICPASTDTVILSVDKNPITPNAGPDLSICSDTVTLSAAAPSQGIGVWSIVSGSLTLSDTLSPNAFASAIQLGTAVLQWTVTSGSCIVSDQMQITVSEPPSQALAGNDQEVCDSTAVLSATPPLVGNGSWSLISGTATIDDPTNPASTVSGIAPGTSVIRWTVSSGTCGETFDELTIIRDIQPKTAQAGPDQSVCADTAQLAAIASPGSGGQWTLISGTATISQPDSASTGITGLGVGTNIFRWTLPAVGSCPAVWDEVSIERNAPTSLAFAGNDTTICSSPYTLNANSPANGTGVWLVIAGNAVLQDSLSASTQVSNLEIGSNVFEWRISNGSCPVETDEVTITLLDTAYAGQDQTICDTIATLSALGVGNWTLISGSGTITQADTAITTVTGLAEGTNIFQWTLTGASCPSSDDQVSIIVSAPPSPANAGLDLSTCNDTATLSAINPTVGTGLWTVIQGAATITDSSLPTSGVSGLSVGLNQFEWRVSNGACPSLADTISITRGDTAYAGVDQIICDSTSTLDALVPSSGTGVWTLVSGTGILADSSDAATSVTGLSDGENIFQWTVTGAACPDSTDQVIITRNCNTPPVIANDSLSMLEDSVLTSTILDPNDYDPDSTTLTVDTTSVIGPNHGTLLIHPDGSFTYTPDDNYNGLDTFIVAVCDSGAPLPALCGQDTVIITIDPVNDPPTIQGETETVAPGASVTDNLLDNDSDIDGTSLTANTTPITGPSHGDITINPDGSFTYTPDTGYVGNDTIIVEVCDSGTPLPEECAPDTIIIQIQGITVIANAGEDQTFCGNSTQLEAQAVDPPGTGVWTIISGNATLSDANSPSSNLTAISSDTVLLVWTVTLNGQTATDTVQIIAHPPATPAFAGEDQVVCGNATELQGNTPIAGTGNWTLVSGTGILSNASSELCGVNGIAPGTSIFAWTITNGTCISSDTVLVQAYIHSAISIAGDSAICPDVLSTTLTATVQGGLTGLWTMQTGTAVFSNDTLPQTTVSSLSPGDNVVVYTISNGPCGASESFKITVLSEEDALCKQEEIFIPEGFSPDGDGANDQLVIYGLKGKHVSLKVFNRWGNLVYESDNYQNNWDGTCSTGLILAGERLPESTYYYLVQIEGENDTRKGYLTLWR